MSSRYLLSLFVFLYMAALVSSVNYLLNVLWRFSIIYWNLLKRGPYPIRCLTQSNIQEIRQSILFWVSRSIGFGTFLASFIMKNYRFLCKLTVSRYSWRVNGLFIYDKLGLICILQTTITIQSMSEQRTSKLGKDVSLQLPLMDRLDKTIDITKSERGDASSIKKHDSGHYRLIQTHNRKRNPSLLEAHYYQQNAPGVQAQNQPEEFKSIIQIPSQFVYDKYQVFDLTFSLINSNINATLMIIIFIMQILIRYFSILCLIYMMVESNYKQWQWIIILLITALLYFTCIVKISVKAPETQSEYILKEAFNSLQQNQNLQYFQVIDAKKLGKSVLRGIVPPQFSFLYIKDMKVSKNMHIYSMINYIYNSLEAIIYYPFFFVYIIILYNNNQLPQVGWVIAISYFTIALSEFMFLTLSIYLLIFGCKKKGYFSKKGQ